jgi:predicted SAM-dependent methyltransferase
VNEASKIRDTILPYLKDKTVLDLGCGDEKIVPWAVGVDSGEEWGPGTVKPDIVAQIDPASCGGMIHEILKGKTFDVVFSSHALEHMTSPVQDTVACWLGLVSSGGRLILYVPDERYYVYDPHTPNWRNPSHRHLLTAEVTYWHVLHLAHAGVLVVEKMQERNRDTGFPDEYSTLVVARRTR